MKKYVQLLRVKHYIKNILILFPLFFAGKFDNTILRHKTLIGSAVFCIICSAVYIVNDINDVEKDRCSHYKRNRPIASGVISIEKAIGILGILFIICIVIVVEMKMNLEATLCLGLYLIINVIYSFFGKNQVIVDICLLASGYPLRIYYGGFLIGVDISVWLFLTVTCFSLYVGLGKRIVELKKEADSYAIRPVLKKYSSAFLNQWMYLTLGLGLVFYSMWTVERKHTLVYTVPLILVICMKYNFLLERETNGDPVEIVLGSRFMVGSCIAYAVVMIAILYPIF